MASQLHARELSADELSKIEFRRMSFVEPTCDALPQPDGTMLLTCPRPLLELEPSIPHLFKKVTARFPGRRWLAERDLLGPDYWRDISYAEFDAQSDSLAQWLLSNTNSGQRGSDERLLIISENSIDHALIIMAAMKAGIASSSVSAPYALLDSSFAKLNMVVNKLQPTLVFAQCAERYRAALEHLKNSKPTVQLVADNACEGHVALTSILDTPVTADVAASIDRLNGDTVAKYMFTSGSTGEPKCVVQTHSILCAQVASILSVSDIQAPDEHHPVSLQWMPWSHVSAGNISYHEAMSHGGTIYLDDGKPVPGLFEKTINNLRYIAPTSFGSAPLGLSWLASALEADESLQVQFFSKLESIAYGGSALPQSVALRIQRLAVSHTGKRIPIISMYGSTETLGVTATYWPSDVPGVIGLPMPGMQIKLAPVANKLAVLAKGPTVLKEYLDDPKITAESFDNEGYFKLGDAARFADPDDVMQGLVFDGRISEDFKLLSGTWVSSVSVKSNLLGCFGKTVRDLVVCGENQNNVCVLAWLDPETKLDAAALQQRLDAYNQANPGSSKRVHAFVILTTPASMVKGEINEKGYVNSKLLAQNYAPLLAKCYAQDTALGVISQTQLIDA